MDKLLLFFKVSERVKLHFEAQGGGEKSVHCVFTSDNSRINALAVERCNLFHKNVEPSFRDGHHLLELDIREARRHGLTDSPPSFAIRDHVHRFAQFFSHSEGANVRLAVRKRAEVCCEDWREHVEINCENYRRQEPVEADCLSVLLAQLLICQLDYPICASIVSA